MSTRPRDTDPLSWMLVRKSFASMGGEARLRAAIDLSEAVREFRIAGLQSRHPGWSRTDAVRHIVREEWGIDLVDT